MRTKLHLPSLLVVALVACGGSSDDAATAASLTLFEDAGSLTAVEMPYSKAGSDATIINCVGNECAAVFDVASFKLRASGQNFTITNLTSTNLTVGSTIVPTFAGLTNGQVIADETIVSFKLRSPIACNATLTLNYSFTVLESGKSFSYTRNLRANCS